MIYLILIIRLILNHQEIISDDLVTIKYSHGTLAENQALNNRYVGHRITVGNEELYLTQYQQYLNPEVHIAYKAVVMELDADGRVTTVTSSLTRLANRDNSQEFAFNFINTGITLQANTDYSIGIMQYGGFDQLNLGVLEYTTANSQDPVVAPDIAQNADDIVLGRIDRVTSGSTSWRPDDAIGHLLTAGPANHRQGKPYFIFHKNLSALFINPPNLALQNAGFQVETVDINNKVKVIDFSAEFVVPDSATEKVQVSIVHASHTLPGVTRYATDAEALAGTAGAHAVSPATLQVVLDDQVDAGGPDATGATDGHVWTADGADSADWEAAPGAGGGTTVVANPTGFSSLTVLHEMSIGGVTYSMNHRGEYSSSGIYLPGDTAWTGQGSALRFWIAREAISAGGTGPSILNPSGWGLIGEGQYKGLFVAVNSYVLKAGDSFRIGDNAYLVKVGGTYTGADLTDSANVIHLNAGGSGGGGSTTPVVYLARTTVDVSSAFAEITLTTALTDGYMLAFDVDSGTGNTVGGRVLVPSTLLRSLPAFPATPVDSTDVEDAYIAAIARVTLTSIITQGLEYLSIWYKDDTHLWILDSRQEMTGVAINGYPMAGAGSGAQSAGISLFHCVAVGAEQTLNGHLLSDSWTNSTFEFISFTDVDVGDLLYIDFTVRIGDEVEQVHQVTRNTLRAVGFQNDTGYTPYLNQDNSVINSAIVPTYMVMGNQGSGNLREDLIRPTMGRVEAHRGSGRGMVMFFFVESGGKLSQINISTRSDLVVKLTRMDIVIEQEAT